MGAQVIVLPNHKGGVTKTSSSATFLVLLHLLGVRVLGIDTDPQSNMSSLFGYKTPLKEKTAYDAIMGQVPLQETMRYTYIHPDGNAFYVPKSDTEVVAGTRFGPYISPMGFKGTDADNELKNSEEILFWPNQLKNVIAPLREAFIRNTYYQCARRSRLPNYPNDARDICVRGPFSSARYDPTCQTANAIQSSLDRYVSKQSADVPLSSRYC